MNLNESFKWRAQILRNSKRLDSHFEKRIDLNRNGRREPLVVSVYERQNGVQGRFAAIFEKIS